MNTNLINEINELVVQYLMEPEPETLNKLDYMLRLHELQIQLLKSKIQLVENPEHLFKTAEISTLIQQLSHRNAFKQHELIIPLLMYLFKHHHQVKPALDTALRFMKDSAPFLRAGDYGKTKTGVQRFLTNTRFAVMTLRNLGLIRSGSHKYNKNWELTIFGILLAGSMLIDGYDEFQKEIKEQKGVLTEGAVFGILRRYLRNLSSPEEIIRLTKYIFSDPVVDEQLSIYRQSFIEFISQLQQLTERVKNPTKETDAIFSLYIKRVNKDENISLLADAIILKKELDVNMAKVYEILHSLVKAG